MAAAQDPDVDRSQVEEFLKTCIDLVKSDDTRKALKAYSGRPTVKIVEIQQGVWDKLGISTQAGRQAIGRINKNSPDDSALVALREEFAKTIDAAYLQCLEDRRPKELKKKGKMSRSTILEFCDASSVKLDMPEVQERLRTHIKETGAMPDPVLNTIHDEVMELLGFDPEYGQACFKDLGARDEFAHDREVATKYARWRGKTSDVCLALLYAYRKDGGELAVDESVKSKLLEMQAREELDTMSMEERSVLLENNAKKVNVFRALPPEGRQRYLERLGEQDKVELAKSEILMVTLTQIREQKQAQDAKRREE